MLYFFKSRAPINILSFISIILILYLWQIQFESLPLRSACLDIFLILFNLTAAESVGSSACESADLMNDLERICIKRSFSVTLSINMRIKRVPSDHTRTNRMANNFQRANLLNCQPSNEIKTKVPIRTAARCVPLLFASHFTSTDSRLYLSYIIVCVLHICSSICWQNLSNVSQCSNEEHTLHSNVCLYLLFSFLFFSFFLDFQLLFDGSFFFSPAPRAHIGTPSSNRSFYVHSLSV